MDAPPASPEPRVSILVVSARDPPRLLRCLAAVERESGDVPIEVVVVLNAAEPDMRAALERDAPRARIVESQVALGFAGATNLAARHARGQLLHLLHDDTEVRPGWLTALIDALDDYPRAGAAGSLVLDPGGAVQTAGQVQWRDGRSQPPWHEPPAPEELREVTVRDTCGSASLLVRRAAWDAAGGLNEELHPAQYVDADLAMALRSNGWLVVCAPRSHVVHERGGSSSRRMKHFATVRNCDRFAARWARELAQHEPYADDAQAIERAAESTRRRTEALLSVPPPAPPPAGPAQTASETETEPETETEAERLRRERRALQRELDFRGEYIAHLEQAADAAEATLHAADRGFQELLRRSQMLAAIEAGGWWRLRGTLRPLLAVASRVRRGLRRR